MSDLRKRTRAVSIYEVAEAAGVSYATVSRALNNRRDVNPETRRRILEIAQQLGYKPSPIARGLSTRSTAALGIIVPGIADPFFMPITQGIEEAARQKGFATLLHNTGRSAESILEGAIMFSNFRVAGVIILGGSQELDEAVSDQLDGIPAVVVLRQAGTDLFPSVHFDHTMGAQEIIRHFLTTGRKRIAHVSGDDGSVAAKERLRGYQEALHVAGIPVLDKLIVPGQFTIEGGAAATDQLLSLPAQDRPDAIFYASDTMALAGMSRLHQAGVKIPDDIAVAGFGNIDFASISEPSLTTVGVSKKQLGQEAARLLGTMIDAPDQRPEDIEIQIELIVRASS